MMSRSRLGLVALVVAVALLLSGGGWYLLSRDPWVSRTGLESSVAAVALDHPKSWVPKEYAGQFVVLAPTDLVGIFSGDQEPARRTLQTDPTHLVGAYVTTNPIFELGPNTPIKAQLGDKFPGIDFQSADEVSVAPAGTERVSGTMRPKGSVDPELQYDLVVQSSASAGNEPGVLMLFGRVQDRDRNQPIFDRIIASMRTP